MPNSISVVHYALRWLTPVLALVLMDVSVGQASTIDISGSVMGTASVDLHGRCAPYPTVSAMGTGVATGLGHFDDTQSHCTNANFSFNKGIFDLVSRDTPGDSLFGTYNGTASLQNGLLQFTATLLVNGGTGLFSNDFGTLQSSGELNQNTGAFSASFSGSVGTVPEPSTVYLVLVAPAVAILIRNKPNPRGVNSR